MPFPTKEQVQKTFENTPPRRNTFYVTPYATPNPGQPNDFNLRYVPDASYNPDISIAFFTINETEQFGNTISDVFLTHIRDKEGIKDFITHMKALNRKVFVAFIDTPNIHWDQVNIPSFVDNTEGQLDADGHLLFGNYLMNYYDYDGIMYDAETDGPYDAMAEVMKANFLRGIQRDPDNHVFVYTTYENRYIDQIILTTPFVPSKSPVDQALCDLGFNQISDFITKRGSLSVLETMSYGASAEDRFHEADGYALQLAKNDATMIPQMRKFISIGVAPGNSLDDAITIAKACSPTKEDGYGRFMVWAGNCPEGVSLFESMTKAQMQLDLEPVLEKKPSAFKKPASGNRHWFFPSMPTPKDTPKPADPQPQSLYDRWLRPVFGGSSS